MGRIMGAKQNAYSGIKGEIIMAAKWISRINGSIKIQNGHRRRRATMKTKEPNTKFQIKKIRNYRDREALPRILRWFAGNIRNHLIGMKN